MIKPVGEVLVMGCGPSVFKEKLGKLIDTFPTVVRINDYRTNSFEDAVGSKIDFWITGAGTQSKIKGRDLTRFQSVLFLPTGRIMKYTVLDIAKQVRENLYLDSMDFTVISSEFMTGVKKHSQLHEPSTGAMAIMFMLYYFRLKRVVIHGFDHFVTKRHYYDQGDFYLSDRHDWVAEAAYFQRLKKEGKLIELLEYKEEIDG